MMRMFYVLLAYKVDASGGSLRRYEGGALWITLLGWSRQPRPRDGKWISPSRHSPSSSSHLHMDQIDILSGAHSHPYVSLF